MSHHDDIELARRAKEALSNPALEAAFARYREKIVDELQKADPREVAFVMTLKRHLSSLSVVRKNLEIMMADGAEAKQKLDFERTLTERAQAALRRKR